MKRSFVWIGLIALLLPVALLAADAGKNGKKQLPRPEIERLAWLAGSWRMEKSGRLVEEQWMAPAGGVMLGMGRTLAKGKVVEHEFLQIRVGPGGDLFYVSMPSGQKEATYRHTLLTDKEVVFENPNHDFPQKITYTLKADGALLVVAEGPGDDGTAKRSEFSYVRVGP